MNLARKLYTKLVNFGPYLAPFVLLIIRLAWGFEMYLSGYRHLHNIDSTTKYFTELGIPFPRANVYASGSLEMIGGILLMLGLASRLISVPLIFNFLVAIITAGKDSVKQAILGGEILRPDRYAPGHLGGIEAIIDDTAFPFLIASLVIFAFGPGWISLDALFKKIFVAKPAPPT